MVEIKDEGICRFCLSTFAGRSMGRHLRACQAKKSIDSQRRATDKKLRSIYHLKIWGYKPFWLHIEAASTVTLSQLDGFLRNIWLECCGHLSQFTIDGIGYAGSFIMGDVPELDAETMDIALEQVLNLKDKFEYEYDFGTTTDLQGQVFAIRRGVIDDGIQILARNTRVQFPCHLCGKPATEIDVEDDQLYCPTCFSDELGDDYDMSLPVVNSPRMGECGYTGDTNFDDFDAQIEAES